MSQAGGLLFIAVQMHAALEIISVLLYDLCCLFSVFLCLFLFLNPGRESTRNKLNRKIEMMTVITPNEDEKYGVSAVIFN